jgi:hypothetical protein
MKAVLRIRIRMDLHDFGLLDPHPESAFQMRIPDADVRIRDKRRKKLVLMMKN